MSRWGCSGILSIWQDIARMRVLQTSAELVAFPFGSEERFFRSSETWPWANMVETKIGQNLWSI